MPVSGREWEALKAIADLGGSTVTQVVSRMLGVGVEYARTICMGLGTADYIDLSAAGKCQVTEKGWRELERKGWRPPLPKEEAAAVNQITCPRCGAPNKPGTRFCTSCAQFLVSR